MRLMSSLLSVRSLGSVLPKLGEDGIGTGAKFACGEGVTPGTLPYIVLPGTGIGTQVP